MTRKTIYAVFFAALILLAGIFFLTKDPASSQTSVPEPIDASGSPVSAPVQDPVPSTGDSLPSTPAQEPEAPASVTPSAASPAGSVFSVHYLDVGQADAALVACDGHYMLVDGGNKDDSSVIYTVLKNTGVSRLDLVVATHAHEDHIGGIPGAFHYACADVTLCPVTSYDSDAFRDFAKCAEESGGGITVPNVGDCYALGSAAVTVLGVNGGDDTNDTSIVLMVTYGDTSFLFAGDAEREAEQTILDSGADLSATVLKVGHHGSDSSTTYPFLRAVMPQYAVISVGAGNSYGHPADDTLSRLRDADVELYRTDLNGDIYVTSDGKTVTVSSDRTANVTESDPSSDNPASGPSASSGASDSAQTGGTNYIVNKNTGKFHYPDCASVSRMKESNKVYFTGSRDELIAQGYSPCGNCNP